MLTKDRLCYLSTTAETYFTENHPEVKLLKFDQYSEAYIIDGTGTVIGHPNYDYVLNKFSPIKEAISKVTYTWTDKTEKSSECLLDKVSDDEILIKLISENRVQSIHSSEPTLNDIFMDITGRTLL